MKVLVTGHNGYIGQVLVPLLIEHGHEVSGYDSDLFESCLFGEPCVEVPALSKDIRDAGLDDVSDFDAVIHLAGLSNDPMGDYNPELTYEINYKASVKLAKLCKQAGVPRFLFASSCSNYGSSSNEFIGEGAEFNPVTPYGESKVLVERDVSLLADDTFCPVYLRASTAYGMSPRLRFDLVANNLTAWAFTEGLVYLKSDGTPWRPIVHVEDISRAYLAALEAPRELVFNRGFNVGLTTENYQIFEIAEVVKKTVPGSKVEFANDASPDKRNYRVDCNLIATTLRAFKPQWTLDRGIAQLYEAYTKNGLTLEDFEGSRYKRIAHIKKLIDEHRLTPDLRWI